MLILSLVILSVYFFFILVYTIGWFSLSADHPHPGSPSTKVSILVPVRNEERNISLLMRDLIKQDYPVALFEVIFIDDNSGDHTVSEIHQAMEQYPNFSIRLIQLKGHETVGAYKKFAISQAIDISIGDLIVTTDADCRMSKKWLSSLVNEFEANHYRMIVGPVKYGNEKSFFEKMQSLEFISLIGITGGAIKAGWPLMCNGANLAYEKQTFYAVDGYEKDHFSSGDDIFLLMKIRRKFGKKSIGFLKNRDAFVTTHPQKNIDDFINQRKRWASKNKAFNLKIVGIAFWVYLTNLMLPVLWVLSIIDPSYWKLFLVYFFLKLLIDLPLVLSITRFIRRMDLFITFIPLLFIYPVYIVVVGFTGIFGKYKWKGRIIRK